MSGMIRLILMLWLALTASGCAAPTPEEEEPAVYRALLEHLGADEAKLLVVLSESLRYEQFETMFHGYSDSPETRRQLATELLSLQLRNEGAVPLAPLITGWKEKLRFVDDETFTEIFSPEKQRGKPWRSFSLRYRNAPGFLAFSRPGFGARRSTALLYFEFACGPVCGRGGCAFLTRDWNGWHVEWVSHEWVS